MRKWLAWLGVVLSCMGQGMPAAETVILHTPAASSFDLAGYYAALEKGYYRDAGLTLQIVEGTSEGDSLKAVMDGRAMFGIGSSSLLLDYANGEPVVVLGAIFQRASYPGSLAGTSYGGCYFTSREQLERHGERVRAFCLATIKGWTFAMEHEDEMIDLLVGKYGLPQSREELRRDAARVRQQMQIEVVPPGYMNTARWEEIEGTYTRAGLLDAPVELSGFLYRLNPHPNLLPYYLLFGGGLVSAGIALGVALTIRRRNKRLREEITLRERSERLLIAAKIQVEQAVCIKEEFLAHVSHDLRAPLNTVLAVSEMMQSDDSEAKRTTDVQTIHTASHSLLSLIDDLLDLNSVESGRIDMADHPFLLDDALDPVISLLTVAARRKGVELVHWIEPGLQGGLRGDADRLRQMLLNLGGNAVKFTNTGHITITASQTDTGWLCIEVTDTGLGIAPEDLGTIFEPFTRAKGTRERRIEGSGLGLTIVRRFAEAMGGRVSARSEQGQGSTFTLELPLIDPAGISEDIRGLRAKLAGCRIHVHLHSELRQKAVARGLASLGAYILDGPAEKSGATMVVDAGRTELASWKQRGLRIVEVPEEQAILTRRSCGHAVLAAPMTAVAESFTLS